MISTVLVKEPNLIGVHIPGYQSHKLIIFDRHQVWAHTNQRQETKEITKNTISTLPYSLARRILYQKHEYVLSSISFCKDPPTKIIPASTFEKVVTQTSPTQKHPQPKNIPDPKTPAYQKRGPLKDTESLFLPTLVWR